jgi:iron complex outermembrane receptor protein
MIKFGRTIPRLACAVLSVVSYAALTTSLAAQDGAGAARQARAQELTLPPITVRSTKKPKRARRAAVTRAPAAAAPQRPLVQVESGAGSVVGYVGKQSLSATKGNAPLIETPQAVSVVGAEQIRDQQPN